MTETIEKKLTILVTDEDSTISSDERHCHRCSQKENSNWHKHVCSKTDVPPPDDEKGRNLSSIQEAREWLSHPANQKDTKLFIIGWRNGTCPLLSIYSLDELWDYPILAECVLYEQKRRKHGFEELIQKETE